VDETHYHTIVDATLNALADSLEPAFDRGALEDLTLQSGVLTLVTQSGTTLVISKHTASRQLWLASPVSGGLHFSYDSAKKHWQLADGRVFHEVLTGELSLHQIEVTP